MAKGLKTGGRKKGAPNKSTLKRKESLAASGLNPVDYLLQVMRDTGNDTGIRIDAAKAVAPYLHPKLANVQISGDQDNPLQHNVGVSWMTEAQAKARGWG